MDSSRGHAIPAAALSGHLVIDLKALVRNYQTLAAQVSPAEAAAVVKADAYGLGASEVAPALRAAGCRKFFVAHLQEAASLKAYLQNGASIFILNGLLPGGEHFAASQGFIPVLNSLEQIANWQATAQSLGKTLPAILQFDTGMSRLGLAPQEREQLINSPSLLDGLDIHYVMSHLASADDSASDQNADQQAVMQAIAEQFSTIPVCFANSGGIFMDKAFHGALARPGIALYGGVPSDKAGDAIHPVVRLNVRVVQTRTVPAETRVGYGGTYITRSETRLATIAAGYADGLPRSLSDRGAAYYGDVRLPIVGRVSMDSLTIDISALPADSLTLGSMVELIGPHQSLEEIAASADTISWEILTRLGHRYQREYIQ
ncbi:alanine racemase [Agrobacterium vitis]|nr:alanine racemase [Agrobacterium vitis]MBE1437991.1 alanine racemase [Agrobacterium vitis]